MPSNLMKIPEVAELLRLSERNAYDMCREGKLPGVAKVGGKWRVEKDSHIAWLKAGGEARRREESHG